MFNSGSFGGFNIIDHGFSCTGASDPELERFMTSKIGGNMCDGRDSSDEILHNEKSALRVSLKCWELSKPPAVCRQKNSEDSIKYRKFGNDFYNTKMPDERTHEKVWRFYTQSIALAPNGSPELALGYGNRSALLFHLQKYEDCIKDCDRAIEITCCDFLKCKLMCRKAECLALLNKNSTKSVCNEALKKLSELTVKEDLKNKFVDKLHNILNTLKITNSYEQTNKPEDLSALADLKFQKEASGASKSIKISYSKQWGRHITATKDIMAGDIIAIPNNMCTLLLKPGMYLFCSNCIEPAWSSIPCRYCIFDVYCSEKCMLEAWNRYHEYECPVYPYIWDIDQELTNGQSAMRLLLIMIHNAGGIKQLKKIGEEVESGKDLRTRGFSSDGIFHSDHSSSMYSHISGSDPMILYNRIYEASTNVHLLATKTDIFGKKMKDMNESDMLKNDDILFTAALLARIDSVLQQYLLLLTYKFGKEKVHYGISLNAFNSLFNHSCNPNVELVPIKGNKTLIYAKHPIKKGEQLFVSYCGEHYLSNTEVQRHKNLKKLFGFECKCQPCSENWSNVGIPTSSATIDVTPGLKEELQQILNSNMGSPRDFQYSLESVKKIKFLLETLSKKVTVHCADYYKYEKVLREMYIKYFGNWTFDMSHKCINA